MKTRMQSHVVPVHRTKNERADMTVIILAANISYGMKSYGPKSLLNINTHETLLEYQLNLIKTVFPNSDIILVVGFEAQKIIRKCPSHIRIVENQLYETSNEVEQVRLALNCTVTNNVLIIKDDIIFNPETLLEISKQESCLIYDTNGQIDQANVGITVIDGYATMLAYEIPTKWCHIVYLAKNETRILKQLCNKKDYTKLYLFEILNMLLQKVGKIRAIAPTQMEIIKIDTSRHLSLI